MIYTAYLAINGNDATGSVNDISLPFGTHKAAEEALEPYKQPGNVCDVVDIGFVSQPQTH